MDRQLGSIRISQRLSRRAALRLLGAGAGLSLLAACSAPAQPAAPAPTQPPAAAAKPAAAATTAPPAAAQPAPTTAPAAASGQKVSLRWFFWTGTEEEVQFWTSLAADAMQQVPNVDIKFETDTFANFWTRLPTMVASGNVPDLIGLQSLRTGSFASRNIYLPLDDLIAADKDVNIDDFNKGIRDGLSYKGKIYALAYDFGPIVVYYNKSLFDKAGVPYPKDDWSWDDFVSTSKALTRDIDGTPVMGFAAPNSFDSMLPFIFSNGGDYVDADFKKSLLSTPATVEAMQWYVDLIYKNKVSGVVDDPGNANWANDNFYGGHAAMFSTGPWNFVNARSKLKSDWDVTLMPRGKAGSVSWIAGSGFGIAAGTRFKNEAWQALKYITSTEGLNKVAKAGRGYPGRVSSVPAFLRTDVPPAHQDVIAKQAQSGKPYRTNSTWQEISDQLKRDLVDPITVLNKPLAETLKAAEPAYQALLDKGAQG
ncbi:MAG TPA: sugar ABC transporter substrate-binding protein [Chloroflexota bacterium]|nr:sugar ABC transporter substrate-binding protein [Chloroflexota bacterium]